MSTLRELAELANKEGTSWYDEDDFIIAASPAAVLDLYAQIDALEADLRINAIMLETAQNAASILLTEKYEAKAQRGHKDTEK